MKGLVCFVLMIVSLSAYAQGGDGDSFRDKLYFGGGGGFGAGTSQGFRYIYYSLFPIVGYKLSPQFSMGSGFNYQHYSYPDLGKTLNQYGVSPFGRYNFGQLFFQTEFDVISSPSYDNEARRTYNRLLFGIGYGSRLNQNSRSMINAMVMYDVLYRQPSVFNSPIVARVFITF